MKHCLFALEGSLINGIANLLQCSDHRYRDLLLGARFGVITCLMDWHRALVALPLVGLAAVAIATLTQRRIRGGTGDVFGAVAGWVSWQI